MQLGALEVIPKPDYTPEQAADFVEKIRLLAGVPVITYLRRRLVSEPAAAFEKTALAMPEPLLRSYRRVVAIASSTGGPQALAVLLPKFPLGFPAPILIAQHISDGFAEGMAQWLNSLCPLPVKVAQEGELLQPGQIYVSPSEQHLTLTSAHRLALISRCTGDIYRPSCDQLLNSVARHCGADAIGMILTGMGRDGAAGMLAIRDAGGVTLAQDEASSVIYGMNQEAVNTGGILKLLPLDQLAAEVVDVLSLNAADYCHAIRQGVR
ncbi:CheB methylesterase domain-containing protein [Nitrincola sp. A-D6]|uniref:CheB methylesterase domain-containing protein n=1 Tax=Nitrincola sp. A-D6 TaxID=1545442 RepID=UPI001F2DC172|nr:CheB methylesterase domain-containing protein [Nitrincola sp. A-D6]